VCEVQRIHIDFVVVLFAFGMTVASALLFGVVPALRAVRPGLMASLRGAGRDTGGHGRTLRRFLVVAQLTFAVVLLVGAGLLVRSFVMMQRVDLGFRTDGIYLSTVRFPQSRYPDNARVRTALDVLLARLRANPAVRSAEATDLPPLGGGGDQDIGAIPIGSAPAPGAAASIWYRSVTPGYLNTLGFRLVSGRQLTTEDRKGAPIVGVINEEAARRFWPGRNPVGAMFATSDDPDATRVTVVGVVGSEHHDGPNQPYKAEVFIPIDQFPSRGVTITLAPRADASALSAVVRETLRDLDPLIPALAIEPLEARAGEAVALPRFYAELVALFAGAALLLAALGVYGVMAHGVAQRRREIGVRLALGASPASIAGMILGEAGRLAIVGALLGLVGAAAIGQLLTRLLFGVTPYDGVTFLVVPLVLAAVTVLAAWLPARRAMRLDPLLAIREE
jgi:predicted permease